LIVALFAGTLVLPSTFGLAAEPTDPTKAETKTEKAGEYVKEKAHKAKVKTKRAAKKTKAKVKDAVANRKTTDPSSPSESKPDAPK
jgi:hypothetical protein